MTTIMPRIQLIIEAESSRQLVSAINQLSYRFKQDTAGEGDAPNEPAGVLDRDAVPAPAAGNGADEPAEYVAPTTAESFPKEDAPAASAPAPKVKRARKAPEPPAQPEEAPEVAPAGALPSLDDLKQAITKAVVAEPHGGPIRTALETLRPTLKVNLIRNASEEHRAALWAFVQQQQIPLAIPDQV